MYVENQNTGREEEINEQENNCRSKLNTKNNAYKMSIKKNKIEERKIDNNCRNFLINNLNKSNERSEFQIYT